MTRHRLAVLMKAAAAVVDHLEAPGVGDPIVTIRVVVIHPVGHVAAEVALDAV